VTSIEPAIDDLRHGACGGVFIDDTGSPGLKAPSHLHPDRKTWVAVIVPQSQMAEVMEQFGNALTGLKELVGADEFHFAEIYNAKGPFRQIDFDVRLAIIEFVAHIFSSYQFPILVQTLDPTKEYMQFFRNKFPKGVGPFDFGNFEDLALFLLVIRVKRLIQAELKGQEVRLVMDTGRFKAGSTVTIPGLSPPFKGGEIVSANSGTLHPIQLADFAAWSHLVARIDRLAARSGRYRRAGPFLTPDSYRAIQSEPRSPSPHPEAAAQSDELGRL
jgi:hypothetical protein